MKTMNLTSKEQFLLHYLKNRKTNQKIDEPVESLFPDYKQAIQNLELSGYLIRDNHSYFLETLTLNDLKQILHDLLLPVSGKKAELIERILNHTSEEQRALICPDLYFVLTENGICEEERYFSEYKERIYYMREKVLTKIKNGYFKEAVYCMCDSYANEVIPPGIGIDWNDKKQIWKSREKDLVEIQNYDWSDLNNTLEFIQLLVKCMFYENLIEHQLWNSINLFIGEALETISCNTLLLFFQKHTYTPNESEKWYTYLSTKRYNSFQESMRNILQDDSYHPLPLGEFSVTAPTIELWKSLQEYHILLEKDIKGFPKTFQTFQKHQMQNSEKYQSWLIYLQS